MHDTRSYNSNTQISRRTVILAHRYTCVLYIIYCSQDWLYLSPEIRFNITKSSNTKCTSCMGSISKVAFTNDQYICRFSSVILRTRWRVFSPPKYSAFGRHFHTALNIYALQKSPWDVMPMCLSFAVCASAAEAGRSRVGGCQQRGRSQSVVVNLNPRNRWAFKVRNSGTDEDGGLLIPWKTSLANGKTIHQSVKASDKTTI